MSSARSTAAGNRKRSTLRKELRNELWSEVNEEDIWMKPSKGFTQIPRCFPQICQILDKFAGKGVPVASTYLSLFCNYFEEGIVEVTDSSRFAFESGFSRARAVTTWLSRLKKLENMGVIKGVTVGGVPYRYILLMCPYKAVEALYQDTDKDDLYTSYIARKHETRAS